MFAGDSLYLEGKPRQHVGCVCVLEQRLAKLEANDGFCKGDCAEIYKTLSQINF